MAVTQRIPLFSRSIGPLLRLIAVAMLIGAMAGWAVTAAHAEPAGGGAKRFGACLASQKAGDLLPTPRSSSRSELARHVVDCLTPVLPLV